MADQKIETITVVSSPGKDGAVLLDTKTTEEITPADPAPTGMYL